MKVFFFLVIKKCVLILMTFVAFAQVSRADVSIDSITIDLFHGKDGKFKSIESNDIDRQMPRAQPFVKIHIVTNGEMPDMQELNLTLEGFGAGRENEAEGKVDDWKYKEVRKSYAFNNFEAFLTPFPCVEKVKFTATISLAKNPKKIFAKKEFETRKLNCYMN